MTSWLVAPRCTPERRGRAVLAQHPPQLGDQRHDGVPGRGRLPRRASAGSTGRRQAAAIASASSRSSVPTSAAAAASAASTSSSAATHAASRDRRPGRRRARARGRTARGRSVTRAVVTRAIGHARIMPCAQRPAGTVANSWTIVGAERVEVVRVAAGDQAAVDDDLLVDGRAAGVADVGAQARVRRQRPPAHEVGLDQRPRARGRWRRPACRAAKIACTKRHDVAALAQRSALIVPAGQDQRVEVVGRDVGDLRVRRERVALVDVASSWPGSGRSSTEISVLRRARLRRPPARGCSSSDLLDAVRGDDRDPQSVQFARHRVFLLEVVRGRCSTLGCPIGGRPETVSAGAARSAGTPAAAPEASRAAAHSASAVGVDAVADGGRPGPRRRSPRRGAAATSAPRGLPRCSWVRPTASWARPFQSRPLVGRRGLPRPLEHLVGVEGQAAVEQVAAPRANDLLRRQDLVLVGPLARPAAPRGSGRPLASRGRALRARPPSSRSRAVMPRALGLRARARLLGVRRRRCLCRPGRPGCRRTRRRVGGASSSPTRRPSLARSASTSGS